MDIVWVVLAPGAGGKVAAGRSRNGGSGGARSRRQHWKCPAGAARLTDRAATRDFVVPAQVGSHKTRREGRGLHRREKECRPGRRAGRLPAARDGRRWGFRAARGASAGAGGGLVGPPLVGQWVGSGHKPVSWWGGLLAGVRKGPAACRWFGGSVDDWDFNGAGWSGFRVPCQRSGCLVGESALRLEGLRKSFAPLSLAVVRRRGFQVPPTGAPRVLASPVAPIDRAL